jgi:hypothetical protein
MKVQIKHLISLLAVVALAACADQPHAISGADIPGFWTGLWHGAIAPWAFIGSLFTDIRVYNFPNTGVWYDFGFLIGIGAYAGGAAAN